MPRKRTPSQRGRPRRAAAPDAVSTEQRLLDVAFTLFAERSYATTSTREIIEAAGVSKPVLYHYYDSKESWPAANCEAVMPRPSLWFFAV